MPNLSLEQVQALIENMSETDFDFFSDLCLNTVFDSLESVPFPNEQTKRQVLTHLNTARFELQVSLAPKNEQLWTDVDLDGLQDLLSTDPDDDTPAANDEEDLCAQIQVELISITKAGAHAGESLSVAALLVNVSDPFENFTLDQINSVNLMWLPELELGAHEH